MFAGIFAGQQGSENEEPPGAFATVSMMGLGGESQKLWAIYSQAACLRSKVFFEKSEPGSRNRYQTLQLYLTIRTKQVLIIKPVCFQSRFLHSRGNAAFLQWVSLVFLSSYL